MKGFFPGTFNPPTLGHKDILRRASHLCETLYVALGNNLRKESRFELFSVEEREWMLKEISKSLTNVQVVSFSGLVIDAVKAYEVDVLIRGIRSHADLDYEIEMASANCKMAGIETVFLMAEGAYSHLNASLIQEIGSHGRRLSGFVPDEIEEVVFKRLCQKHP